jgi:hypothetical protein
MVRKGLTAAAVVAMLSSATALWAADAQQPQAADLSQSPLSLTPVYMDSTPTTLTPAMYLLDPTPVGKWMENNKLSITGFVDGGYFYDTSNPRLGTGPKSDNPTFVTFPGQYSNRGLLDQADLSLSKTIDSTKSWDWGFLIEAGYGVDDSYTHSDGILDNRPPGDPETQFDLLQADVSLLVPIGSGVTFTAGKFVGILSQEVINPTGNLFFTHSYNFFYGVPATNTGVTASYTFAKALMGNDLTVMGGITRGWNQSSRDNNGAIDGIFQAKSNITSKLSAIFNVECGPEATKDNSDYWTTPELILTYALSDQLTLTGDFLYSDFPHGGAVAPGANAQWYGAVAYASYKFSSYFTANVRGEWYRDQGGFTTGNEANYYEATAGVDIHPFPNDNILQWLQLRPEVREDWSDRPVFNIAHNDGGGDYQEFTVAMDALMQF